MSSFLTLSMSNQEEYLGTLDLIIVAKRLTEEAGIEIPADTSTWRSALDFYLSLRVGDALSEVDEGYLIRGVFGDEGRLKIYDFLQEYESEPFGFDYTHDLVEIKLKPEGILIKTDSRFVVFELYDVLEEIVGLWRQFNLLKGGNSDENTTDVGGRGNESAVSGASA